MAAADDGSSPVLQTQPVQELRGILELPEGPCHVEGLSVRGPERRSETTRVSVDVKSADVI